MLSLKQFLGNDFQLDDAVPKKTNAQNVWDVDHLIYGIWNVCMILFFAAAAVVIIAVLFGRNWFT